MISSFGDKRTGDFFHGRNTAVVRRIAMDIRSALLSKLDLVQGVEKLLELRSPLGNRLEALSGDLSGFYSIRVNDQWRIIFRWESDKAHEVKLIITEG
jgi:toxin HigB-1